MLSRLLLRHSLRNIVSTLTTVRPNRSSHCQGSRWGSLTPEHETIWDILTPGHDMIWFGYPRHQNTAFGTDLPFATSRREHRLHLSDREAGTAAPEKHILRSSSSCLAGITLLFLCLLAPPPPLLLYDLLINQLKRLVRRLTSERRNHFTA